LLACWLARFLRKALGPGSAVGMGRVIQSGKVFRFGGGGVGVSVVD
jgi:hypothetical protein